MDAGDAVGNLDHPAHLGHVNLRTVIFDFIFQYPADFFGLNTHASNPFYQFIEALLF
jgi:hypothetical protein